MSEHRATLDFDGGYVTQTLTCTAPPHSMCHAVFDCDCDEFYDSRVVDDHPVHVLRPDDYNEQIHTGRFSPSHCTVREWSENLQEEILHGQVTFDVRVEYQTDFLTLHPINERRDNT